MFHRFLIWPLFAGLGPFKVLIRKSLLLLLLLDRLKDFLEIKYSKMSLLRPLEIKTTSLLRPVFASPEWYFPYDISFNIKTTPLIRPLSGSPKGGLYIGVLLYVNSD